ncbi:MAG: ATP-binding protein [Anaerolineae bacterium]|nr:ATP-binding protein [Anaerolineae bacterium]
MGYVLPDGVNVYTLLILVAVSMALPYVSPKLFRYLAVIAGACLVLISLEYYLLPLNLNRDVATIFTGLSGITVMGAMLFVVIWLYKGWADRLVSDLNRTNAKLLEAQATLESQVVARTAELTASNEKRQEEIEQRQRAEVELRAERNFANQVMNNIGQGLCVTNERGIFEFVNPAFASMVGKRVDELVGKSANDAVQIEQRSSITRANWFRLQGVVNAFETKIVHADKGPRYSLVTTVPRWREGKPSGMIALISDITERKMAEEQATHERDFARQVMDAMGQGLAVTGSDERVEYANESLAKLLDENRNLMLGRLNTDWVYPDDMPISRELAKRIGAGLGTSTEIRVRRRDGAPIPVIITAVPRIRAGRVRGSILVLTDIHRIKETEAALKQARDDALEASRVKSSFLAMVSHEIRTPLNAIIGVNELLLNTTLSADQRELAAVSYDSGMALLDVINNILDFSKIESGKLYLENIGFSVRGIVDGSVKLMQHRASEKSLMLYATVSPDVPQSIMGDSGRLRQILLNLISNAIKFTSAGEVEVQVKTDSQTLGTPGLRIAVRDTGIGMSDETRNKIFRPFVQADSSTTRIYGGTGLGLAICSSLVHLMRGQIGVDSVPGKGSTFWVVIPNNLSASESPTK